MREGITLVTGATGFVGSHVVRKLLKRGEKVRILIRQKSNRKNLQNLPVEIFTGDLTDRKSLEEALQGCGFLYHVAADYRLWAPDPWELYRVNVQGTRAILESASLAGVKRIVYTSTVGTLGNHRNGIPANEETPVTLEEMIGHYKRSKFLAEQEAMAAARAGVPVIVVNPSTPVGTQDIKPTPTGQMIVDFLNGRMPAYVDTGLNLIDVEDVAEGHLLAMERGDVGGRYILGNQNLSLRQIFQTLSRISGRPSPSVRLPHSLALALGAFSTGISALTRRPPRIPWEAARMAGKKMFFDSTKAVKELGLPQGSVEEALRKAVDWFRENGYVRR